MYIYLFCLLPYILASCFYASEESVIMLTTLTTLEKAVADININEVKTLIQDSNFTTLTQDLEEKKNKILKLADSLAEAYGRDSKINNNSHWLRIGQGTAFVVIGFTKLGLDAAYHNDENTTHAQGIYAKDLLSSIGFIGWGGYLLFNGIKKRNPKLTHEHALTIAKLVKKAFCGEFVDVAIN